MAFLNGLFTAAFDSNLVFCQLIGMVSVLLVAHRPQDAFRAGGMLWAAVCVGGLLGWPLYTGLMEPWGVAYLAPLAYVVASAGVIFAVGAIATAGKDAETRSRALRTCSLLAVNAAVLGVALGNAAVAETMTFDAALGTSFGAGMGVFIAIVAFAFVYDRIDERLLPRAMRGLPIALVTAALMALAFTGVAGIAGGLFV